MSFSQHYVAARVHAVHTIVLFAVAVVVAVELAHIIHLQVATFHPMPWADDWDTLFLFALAEKAPGTGLVGGDRDLRVLGSASDPLGSGNPDPVIGRFTRLRVRNPEQVPPGHPSSGGGARLAYA